MDKEDFEKKKSILVRSGLNIIKGLEETTDSKLIENDFQLLLEPATIEKEYIVKIFLPNLRKNHMS